MDSLVTNGIELNRHYVHMMCTPSRAAFQSGRLPVHVTTQLSDPCDKNGAIPYNMTGIAEQLSSLGYETHEVGKWDCGMATWKHTPQGRGYETSLNYFGHGNWMYTEREWQGSQNNKSDIPTWGDIDFWDTDKPASHLNGTGYEELLFRDRIKEIISSRNGKEESSQRPLFLNYNSKIAHYPLQAPPEYQNKFSFIEDENRRLYASMVNFLDDQLKSIVTEFKQAGLWNDTLMILTSDNGGYVKQEEGGCNSTTGLNGPMSNDAGHGTVCFNGEAGANNYPLRGGKYSNFEGGIRVNAFVSGGYLPQHVRGTKNENIIHIADWYGTLCNLAESKIPQSARKQNNLYSCFHDGLAVSSQLPDVDSKDQWPILMGTSSEDTTGRETILVHPNLLIHNEWKYAAPSTVMIESAWGGPFYPNKTTADTGDAIDQHRFVCSATTGCLFNIVDDVEERNDVAEQFPDIVTQMQKLMEQERKTIWSQSHENDPLCRKEATKRGGFLGPWK
eukprot:g778.t1